MFLLSWPSNKSKLKLTETHLMGCFVTVALPHLFTVLFIKNMTEESNVGSLLS